ncbi:hypothetical protein QBC45DRAFT_400482 [Copromyces sp. CBS 386.78]|nr:hypothetical protein QBC45DRAFT_400482 [Copromyces sp. CBS 386.78]
MEAGPVVVCSIPGTRPFGLGICLAWIWAALCRASFPSLACLGELGGIGCDDDNDDACITITYTRPATPCGALGCGDAVGWGMSS